MKLWIVLLVLAFCFTFTSSAVIYYLNPEGTGDFATIQEALDECVYGDVIRLADGTYQGEGNRDLDYGGRGVTIESVSNVIASSVRSCRLRKSARIEIARASLGLSATNCRYAASA